MQKVVKTVKLAVILFTPFLVSQQCADFFCLLNPGSILCGHFPSPPPPPRG
jgi:hypothetical protein